jgi:nucleotide-binding universal stress UspA family protein
MNVILLVVDPATAVTAAGVLVMNLARQRRTRVVALRVLPLAFLGHGAGLGARVDPEKAAVDVGGVVDWLTGCGVRATGMLRTSLSGVSKEIAATAAEIHADLIVTGSSTSLLRGIGLGMVRPRRLSRMAPCPVVVAQSRWVGSRGSFGSWVWPHQLRHGG